MSFTSSFLNLLHQFLLYLLHAFLLCLGCVSSVALLRLFLVSGFWLLEAAFTVYSLAYVDSILDPACAVNSHLLGIFLASVETLSGFYSPVAVF